MSKEYYTKVMNMSIIIKRYDPVDVERATQDVDYEHSSEPGWTSTPFKNSILGVPDWAFGVISKRQCQQFPNWESIYKLVVRVHERLIKNKRMEAIEDETLVEVTML